MFKNKCFYFVLILSLITLSRAKAQIEIETKNALEKIKDGKTHIIVQDINFPRSVEYYRIFKKYWTVTKDVDFIKWDDLDGNLVAGDTYLSFERWVGTVSQGVSVATTYLNIWTPSEKEIRKQKHADINSNAVSIANIYLDESTESLVKKFREKDYTNVKFDKAGPYSQYDFDGGGSLLNWSPGIMKNYLQLLCRQLQTGKKYSFGDEITNKAELQLLKNKTLYCTNEVLNKMGFFAGVNKIRTDAEKSAEIKTLFEDYHYDYKVLTSSELEDKILDDKEPFYYLIFLNSSKAGKFLGVVNSRTGDVVYSRCKALSVNLKPGDLKDLYKEIK